MATEFTSVTCGNDYTNAATIRDVFESGGGVFEVDNHAAIYKLQYGGLGADYWTDEATIGTGGGSIPPGVTGIAFRNATAGQNAVVSALIRNRAQPHLTLSFAQAGGVSGVAAGDYKISAQTATHADVSGVGTWYLCNGAAIPASEVQLVALLGPNLPDARGRTLVMLGTNAAVSSLGASDGVAIANRRPQHRHTPHSHTISLRNVTNNLTAGGTVVAMADNGGTGVGETSVDGGSGTATDSLDAPAFIVPGSLFVYGSGQ